MTNPSTVTDYPELKNVDNGCDTLRFLWALSNRDFNLTHPGLTGIGSRVTSFIEIERVPVFMQLSALKCWEERTRETNNNINNIPFPPMPTPGFDDLSRKSAHSTGSGGGSSGSGTSGGSASSGRK